MIHELNPRKKFNNINLKKIIVFKPLHLKIYRYQKRIIVSIGFIEQLTKIQ